MAAFTVEFDSKNKYRESLNNLHKSITDNSWARLVRYNSKQVHTINARQSGQGVALHLRENDLYLVGFENGSGTQFQFKGEEGGSGTLLPVGSSYTDGQGLGILNSDKFKNWPWGADEIGWAIATLSGFKSACDDDFRKAFGVFTYSISEALRFHDVFEKVQSVVAKNASIKFAEFESLVKSWGKHSSGRQLQKEKERQGPPDLTQHDVLKRLKTVKR